MFGKPLWPLPASEGPSVLWTGHGLYSSSGAELYNQPLGGICRGLLRFDLFIFHQEIFFKFSLLRFLLPSDFDINTEASVDRIWAFRDTAVHRVSS